MLETMGIVSLPINHTNHPNRIRLIVRNLSWSMTTGPIQIKLNSNHNPKHTPNITVGNLHISRGKLVWVDSTRTIVVLTLVNA